MGEMNIYMGQTAVSLCFQGTGCIHNLFLNEHPRSYAVRGLSCHLLELFNPHRANESYVKDNLCMSC